MNTVGKTEVFENPVVFTKAVQFFVPPTLGPDPAGDFEFKWDAVNSRILARDQADAAYVGLSVLNIFTGDGTNLAPSFASLTTPGFGLYFPDAAHIGLAQSGAGPYISMQFSGYQMYKDASVVWTASALSSIVSFDTSIKRYAAKQILISGDGIGATVNSGVIIGYSGTSTYGGIWGSQIVTPSIANHSLLISNSGSYTEVGAATGGSGALAIAGSAVLGWTATSLLASQNFTVATGKTISFGLGTTLLEDAANALAQRNGTNNQIFYLYETYTDATNYRRIRFLASSGQAIINAEGVGAGNTTQSLVLQSTNIVQFNSGGSTARWNITAAGHFMGASDNTYDIGAVAATRPRNIYAGSSIYAASLVSSAGAGTGTYNSAGAINTQTSAAGVGNAADATDDTLFTYSLPLNSLDTNGKSVRVRAWGTTAANANNKDIKLWFAGIAIIDSGVLALNASNWSIEMTIVRLDATHVSCVGSWNDNGLTAADVATLANQAVASLASNASIIKVTGASPTITAASDVLGYGMMVEFLN